ncbi:unnamed protein product [Sphenostylis stenocarpa]|uniref:Uncharacterized protein n=1 Tax=Sphenostylis stenocarpa TaxID=92480 RepID=A0AA86TAL3_9FABA|nr:unnamed protein product [Sphenostylis stenocarpa]
MGVKVREKAVGGGSVRGKWSCGVLGIGEDDALCGQVEGDLVERNHYLLMSPIYGNMHDYVDDYSRVVLVE